MQTEKVWESGGNYYTKIPIAVGDYINKKGIGIKNSEIPRTEYKWIGTDYTVHPSKNHPPIPPVESGVDEISWILAHNRKFSIGEVVDIDRKTADNGIHTLYGEIQFKEPQLAKEAYKLGIIPMFNSSSIYETAREEKTGLTTDYVPIDNCAVDTPAGDLELFSTKAFCEGNNECIHQLKQSGINGYCGYCKLEALKSFRFHYPFDSIHTSHNSTNMKQSSSMSSQTSESTTNSTEPKLDTVKEVKNEGKGKSEVEKTGKTINDSGWVSPDAELEKPGDNNENEKPGEGEEEAKSKIDYKKLYEDERAKNESNNKTVQELLAESRLSKIKEKITALPIEVWEGDEKSRAKDITFFNELWDKKIDEPLLMKLMEKYVSKIPIKEIQAIKKNPVGLKQSGMTALDYAITHDYVVRTNHDDGEEQLTEADAVLGALED